ncbi:MAG: alpha amylase C-terminal domain-containing protein, partial [Mucilaginibacter sp.]
SVLIYTRKGHDQKNDLVIVLNMTPNPHYNYRIGVPEAGTWKEIFNSDDKKYWGSGMSNPTAVKSEKEHWHGRDNSINVTLPPLAAVVFKQGK